MADQVIVNDGAANKQQNDVKMQDLEKEMHGNFAQINAKLNDLLKKMNDKNAYKKLGRRRL